LRAGRRATTQPRSASEAAAHVGDRRAIQLQILAERALVDPGVQLQQIQRTELHGGDLGGRLPQPQARVHLLRPPDQEPGVLGEIQCGHTGDYGILWPVVH
jgi:hypothetical protein